MNKILTTIKWPLGSDLTEPQNPVTGESWMDPSTGIVKMFDGVDWQPFADSSNTDTIDNIGRSKANAILEQVFRDERVRNKNKAAQKAWEHYQFILQLAYNPDDV